MSQPTAPVGHPVTAEEYAKIQAVLNRIDGLRRLITSIAILGLITSFLTFILAVNYMDDSNNGFVAQYSFTTVWVESIFVGVAAFLPFVVVMYFFSRRVDRHVERLSRGKYEPPRIIE